MGLAGEAGGVAAEVGAVEDGPQRRGVLAPRLALHPQHARQARQEHARLVPLGAHLRVGAVAEQLARQLGLAGGDDLRLAEVAAPDPGHVQHEGLAVQQRQHQRAPQRLRLDDDRVVRIARQQQRVGRRALAALGHHHRHGEADERQRQQPQQRPHHRVLRWAAAGWGGLLGWQEENSRSEEKKNDAKKKNAE